MRRSIPHGQMPVEEQAPAAQEGASDSLNLQRWLIDHNLFTDEMKNNLYVYGSLVNLRVEAVHVVIDSENSTIHYKLYAPKSLLKDVDNFNKWRHSDRLFDLWRLQRLLKRERQLDFQAILNNFVRDLCGKRWKVTVKLEDVALYVDGPTDDDLRTEHNPAVD